MHDRVREGGGRLKVVRWKQIPGRSRKDLRSPFAHREPSSSCAA